MQTHFTTEAYFQDFASIRWWHRIRLSPEIITPGEVMHGPDDGDWPTTRFGLPNNLRGKSVLDIGCWDGFFSFEAEKRGASRVVAIDVPRSSGGNWGGTAGFHFAKKALRSRVDFHEMSIYDAPILGRFDVVLCYGLLNHLTDVLGAIRSLASVTAPGGVCLIESAIALGEANYLEYRPGFNNDPTNYFYPTLNCLRAMCEECGFSPPTVVCQTELRATIAASMASSER